MIGELNPIEHRAETLDAPMIDLVARYRDYPFVFKPLPILEKWETIDPSDDPNVPAIAKQARCFEFSDEITFLIWSTDSNDYVLLHWQMSIKFGVGLLMYGKVLRAVFCKNVG